MGNAAVRLNTQPDNQTHKQADNRTDHQHDHSTSNPHTLSRHPRSQTPEQGTHAAALPATQTLLPWPVPAGSTTAANEAARVDWLILHFNHWFAHHNVILQRGEHEPEYFPAAMPAGMNIDSQPQPARIVFAHGYFASALHEISHWCIAGAQRRLLADLGYWYAPDGRNAEQQALFEQMEVKPQALEWLFTQACQRKFRVSLDNLNGEAGSGEQFKNHVHARVHDLLAGRAPLPRDAQRLITGLCNAIRAGKPLHADEFSRDCL